MTKINPGSNVHGDNDTKTARAGGMQDVNIPEPRMEGNSFICTICDGVFSTREDYISHALSKHQPVTPETEMGIPP